MAGRVYHFGEFMFDARSGELCRGGSRLRLRPQPSALLEHLVKHGGEVVTREDLRDILWPNGTFVCFDHGLNSCIKQLRAALGDQRTAPRYLETLPRRGYRFIAAIDTGPAPGGEIDLDLSCNLRIVADNCYATLTLTTSNRAPHRWTMDSPVHLRDAFNSDPRIVQSLLETALEWFRSGRFRDSTAPTACQPRQSVEHSPRRSVSALRRTTR
jgi:DNA-binding winged helix-turn-helix (wHTH) protein